MVNKEPVLEMLESFNKIQSDIDSLSKRISTGILSEKELSTNKKYLRMAILEQKIIIELLMNEYTEGISDDELYEDLQRT